MIIVGQSWYIKFDPFLSRSVFFGTARLKDHKKNSAYFVNFCSNL